MGNMTILSVKIIQFW